MSSSGSFQPTGEIERFLFRCPDALKDVVHELRSIVARIAPLAEERILWGGLSHHDPARGGTVKAGICQIGIETDHVRLGFVHGAFLPDPAGLLEGDRLAKRCLRLYDFDSVPWEDVEALINASASYRPGERVA